MDVHIYQPKAIYLGQIQRAGARKWETVTRRCKTVRSAMSKAVMSMSNAHRKARVLLLDDGGWLGPIVVMECSRK